MGSSRYNRKQGQKPDITSKVQSKKVVISYLYQDRQQGQTLEKWDKTSGRLLRWTNLTLLLSTKTVSQAITEKIIIRYDNLETNAQNMPKKSKWKYPEILNSKDVIWCKIVVMQKVRVIGFMEDNIFYVVFLDEQHEFYPTEPHNT